MEKTLAVSRWGIYIDFSTKEKREVYVDFPLGNALSGG
jgi:hypothetical protein